jgi:hypothetical protein
MRETPNHWLPRLTATSTVAVRSNRCSNVAAALLREALANGDPRRDANACGKNEKSTRARGKVSPHTKGPAKPQGSEGRCSARPASAVGELT